jgi:hypothetical protein
MDIPSDSGEVSAWSGVLRLRWSNHGALWTAHWQDQQQLAGCKVGVWGGAVWCFDLGCAEPCDRATGESTCIMHGCMLFRRHRRGDRQGNGRLQAREMAWACPAGWVCRAPCLPRGDALWAQFPPMPDPARGCSQSE